MDVLSCTSQAASLNRAQLNDIELTRAGVVEEQNNDVAFQRARHIAMGIDVPCSKPLVLVEDVGDEGVLLLERDEDCDL